jgi:hypothetical protein
VPRHLDQTSSPTARFALVLAALVVSSGCVAGYLPSLRTERVDIAGMQSGGLTLRIRLSATNDRYHDTIVVDSLQVHVVVNGQDLGTLEHPQSWDLPPNQPVFLDADVTVPIQDLPSLALAAAAGPVPYELDGRAHVRNIGWSVDFRYAGHIPQEQFMGAAIPQIPGIPLVFP